MRNIIFAVVLGFGVSACGTVKKVDTPQTVNYLEKSKVDTEKCVIKMLRAGFRQQLIYSMCKDIHKEEEVNVQKRPVSTTIRR